MDDIKMSYDSAIYAYGKFAEALNSNMVYVGQNTEKTKSELTIGNMVFYNTHRFNWLERKMWKLLLGFDIENMEDD